MWYRELCMYVQLFDLMRLCNSNCSLVFLKEIDSHRVLIFKHCHIKTIKVARNKIFPTHSYIHTLECRYTTIITPRILCIHIFKIITVVFDNWYVVTEGGNNQRDAPQYKQFSHDSLTIINLISANSVFCELKCYVAWKNGIIKNNYCSRILM